ncbi:sodium:proton antiporter [Aureisphaera galaxeae]|uniref:cation:proton antiporter n=1 Tax=Aureisphaera galaxeae TaxID=1538023 RepID=UPI0023509248|nr:sodium:proton antiporter [Aureisphaera galaxeae]MDC8006324.1 sodium:proton antiporter [Aureisphaera galaxeae]
MKPSLDIPIDGMDTFQLFIAIISLAAVFSIINRKLLKLPDTIGVMLLAILTAGGFGLYSFVDKETFMNACQLVEQIDFKEIVFDFLLGFLLFAGAIHVNLTALLKERGPVIIYASFGVLISTLLIGTALYGIVTLLSLNINYLYCLVFGALISPTDPVAVLALLKKAGAPKDLEIKIVGESLFNDGVGIVVFLSIFSLATMMEEFSMSHIGLEFLQEAGGGLAMGALLGYVGSRLIQNLRKQPILAVHVSLAIVMGGYSLSSLLHVSGALAMVMAGLMVGNTLRKESACKELQVHMNVFWKVIDEILNSVLFVLIGVEIIALDFNLNYLIVGLLAIVIVLVSRFISVVMANVFLRKEHRSDLMQMYILTWAGLRGGISIALALSLPEGEIRDALLFTTYVVVVFSIIVQGLTIERLILKLLK